MSLVSQSVPLNTNGDGEVTRDVRVVPARLVAVAVELGTLTTPDITLTDEPAGVTLLAVSGLADDARYNLAVQSQGDDGEDLTGAFGPPAIFGRVHVDVANGGANKTGRLVLYVER